MEERKDGTKKSVGLSIDRSAIRQASHNDLHSLAGLEVYNVDELEKGRLHLFSTFTKFLTFSCFFFFFPIRSDKTGGTKAICFGGERESETWGASEKRGCGFKVSFYRFEVLQYLKVRWNIFGFLEIWNVQWFGFIVLIFFHFLFIYLKAGFVLINSANELGLYFL